jgi:hypothetical protein
MSTVHTHQSHPIAWIASAAAVAGILVSAGIAGAAAHQHDEPVSPNAPGSVTLRLPHYPHLSHAWRIHHAQSKSNEQVAAAHLRR